VCTVVIREGRLEIHGRLIPTVVTVLRNFMLIGNLIRMLLWIWGGGGERGHKEKDTSMQRACITERTCFPYDSLKYLKPVPTGQGFCAM
jgi:hypothetical protein